MKISGCQDRQPSEQCGLSFCHSVDPDKRNPATAGLLDHCTYFSQLVLIHNILDQ